MKKNIQPDIDLQNSIECHRILDSHDMYQGKSFNYAGEWISGIHYFNDRSKIDFVSVDGMLFACQHTHVSSGVTRPTIDWVDNKPVCQSKYWSLAMWNKRHDTEFNPQFKVDTDGNKNYIKYSADGKNWAIIGEFNTNFISRVLEKLPENAADYAGQIVFIHNNGVDGNDYLEYIAVPHGDVPDYHWELLGGDGDISNEQIADITESITTVENQINVIATDITRVEQSINNLTTDVNSSITSNTSNIANISSQVKNINIDITNLEARIESLETISPASAPLKEVRLNGQILEFVYIIDGQDKIIEANISDLITNEEIGNGLQQENGAISVKINPDDAYLTVSDKGLSMINLDSKFETMNQEIHNINQEITEVRDIVQNVENFDGGEIKWE